MLKKENFITPVPSQWVGPVCINGLPNATESNQGEWVSLPLATYESPLWPSVRRGARVLSLSGGITTTLVGECMTRSIIFHCQNTSLAIEAMAQIRQKLPQLQQLVTSLSRFTQLQTIDFQPIGNLLYLRLSYQTGDASGHNMVTLACDRIQAQLLQDLPQLGYGSISGNLCVDKKNSALNGILGRGKHVIADCLIPKKILTRYLHTSAAKIERLNVQKNLIGSIAAGSVRSANAHYANMLLAFYLACGQDAANVVEGSQGITHVECRGPKQQDLYFSVSIPNLIVGSVGNGKHLQNVKQILHRLGCQQGLKTGQAAQRLAMIAAACVACGELSLLAAQTNPGELVQAHLRLERAHQS